VSSILLQDLSLREGRHGLPARTMIWAERFTVAEDAPHIVQYRSFLQSVLSDFDFRVYRGGRADTRDEFYAFAIERLPVYAAFRAKWAAARSSVVC